MRTRQLVTSVLAAAALTTAVTACDPSSRREERIDPEPTTEQALVDEALRFGGIVLPPSATVLGVARSRGLDTLYTLAVEVDSGEVDQMLAESQFTPPLQQGYPVHMDPAVDIAIGSGPDIESAQHRLPPADGRTVSVVRKVLVDHSDPERTVVHLWLFDT